MRNSHKSSLKGSGLANRVNLNFFSYGSFLSLVKLKWITLYKLEYPLTVINTALSDHIDSAYKVYNLL